MISKTNSYKTETPVSAGTAERASLLNKEEVYETPLAD